MLCGYWQSQGEDNPALRSPHLQEGFVLSDTLYSKLFPKMNEILFTFVQSCRQQFCPTHRFPGDHSCSGPVSVPAKPNAFANGAKHLNSKATTAGAAAMDVVKKTMATAVTSDPKPSGSSSRPTLPFNKMDRYVHVSPGVSSTRLSSTSLSNIFPTTDLNEINDPITHPPLPTPTTKIDNIIIKPSPIINAMSFIPRPIFASA